MKTRGNKGKSGSAAEFSMAKKAEKVELGDGLGRKGLLPGTSFFQSKMFPGEKVPRGAQRSIEKNISDPGNQGKKGKLMR